MLLQKILKLFFSNEHSRLLQAPGYEIVSNLFSYFPSSPSYSRRMVKLLIQKAHPMAGGN